MPFSEMFVHLVWATWDRAPWINAQIESQVWALLGAKCQELRCKPLAVGGMPDHVHVLVGLDPSLAVAELVRQMKGASSYAMTHRLGPARPFRWQRSYSVFSLRKAEVPTVVQYVTSQKQRHAAGRLSELMERLDSPDSPGRPKVPARTTLLQTPGHPRNEQGARTG
ncbi:MAG: IS200/IS605 family transposase [Deltaproteobacteria bacterium]|nr:IS200/IS605 family transposase [Deltaproteobacteria bacterium]